MYRRNLPIHRCAPGRISNCRHVPCSWCVQERLLQVAEPTSLQAVPKGRSADHENQGNTWADREVPTGPVGYTRSFGPRASASAKSAPMA